MAAQIQTDVFRVLIPRGLYVGIAELIPQSLQLQAQTMSQPKLMSQVGTVRKVIGTNISVFLPSFICLCSKGNHVTNVDGLYFL